MSSVVLLEWKLFSQSSKYYFYDFDSIALNKFNKSPLLELNYIAKTFLGLRNKKYPPGKMGKTVFTLYLLLMITK